MSRTVRRKTLGHVNNRWWKRGSSVAGYYTECDVTWEQRDDGRWMRIYHYREPTKQERFKTFQWLHGESSHHNARTPGPWFRENRMRQNRMINKQELHRWATNPDNYEPLFEADPRSCQWDWD